MRPKFFAIHKLRVPVALPAKTKIFFSNSPGKTRAQLRAAGKKALIRATPHVIRRHASICRSTRSEAALRGRFGGAFGRKTGFNLRRGHLCLTLRGPVALK